MLFAVLLGFIQEYRAERAIEALRQMAAPTASVLRDGMEVKIPARELVPGDVILLHTGDRMPADARLVEAVNLQVEEAALTGESVAVEKHIEPLPVNDLPVGDRKNMVYAGTAATYGRGKALVAATGMQTEFGKIAQLLQTVETGKTRSSKIWIRSARRWHARLLWWLPSSSRWDYSADSPSSTCSSLALHWR